MKTGRMVLILAAFVIAMAASATASAAVNKTNELSTGLQDQTGLALTIYNQNIGLVKDQRKLRMPRGTESLKFMDVASGIIPASVQIKSLANAGSLQVLEQNYEYDLLNPQKLMDKYVGKQVKLYQKNPYTDRVEIVNATLLANNGGPVYRIGNEITFNYPGRVIFPSVPKNLISKPTLVWLLKNSLAAPQKIEALYLTNGINWKADYVVTLNGDDKKADLSGWVTIDNKSGATYRNAKIKLVAGNINIVRPNVPVYARLAAPRAMVEAAPQPQFKEEGFFEYHIYTLQRLATVKNNQTKQISLISASGVKVKKELVLNGADWYYMHNWASNNDGSLPNQKVGVYIVFKNKKENGLSIPLPKGTVRVYKKDKEGSLKFVGEDSIDHTPKGEKVRLKLGDAFDVVATKKQTDWKKIDKDTYEAAFELSIRNHEDKDMKVRVIEPIPGDWTMLNSNYAYQKTAAHTAEFEIPVQKDKEAKLVYSVRMKF